MSDWTGPCACVGPQHGDPLCPCGMRSLEIKDGRYVRVQDFGPAPSLAELDARKQRLAESSARLKEAVQEMFAKRAHPNGLVPRRPA